MRLGFFCILMRMRWGRGSCTVACVAWLVLAAGHAVTCRAQESVATTQSVPAAPAADSGEWSSTHNRVFLAGQFALGALADARVVAGYGKPHWTWLGLEAGALSTTETAFGFARARLALVLVDVALTWRHTWAYARGFASRAEHYAAADLDSKPRAQYSSLDLWLWGYAPVPLGLLDWELEAVHAYGLPQRHDVYEEYLRAVTSPRWLVSARLGYEVVFANEHALLGPMVEATWIMTRGLLWRLGPDFSWRFSPEWDVGARLTFGLASPDDLGFYNNMGGTLRVRFRWATGRSTKPRSQ